MLKLRKMIAEAISMVITESDVEAAFESVLENYDFSESLERFAQEKIEDFAYFDEAVAEAANDFVSD